jgi:pimeloyl-ACP methyl ester carboxylesterase
VTVRFWSGVAAVTEDSHVTLDAGLASEQFVFPMNAKSLLADEVQSVVIPGTGHWVAETAPEEMLAAVTAFLAVPGRGAHTQARW